MNISGPGKGKERMRSGKIRHYPAERFSSDFYKVIDFLKKHGACGHNKNWHWARWEWLMGHGNLDMDTLDNIGLLEIDNVVEGIATHDMRRGEAYILCNPEYFNYRDELLGYAACHLSDGGQLGIYIDDADTELAQRVIRKGYALTEEKEHVLALDCSQGMRDYRLADDFSLDDYAHNKDLNKYNRVIWRGFNHEGLPPLITESDVADKPHENPDLAVFVAAKDGEYAAHCGTWYLPDTTDAYIEPVVTVPAYRRRGLGKAAVYESVNRCAAMGAKRALVISNQPFYYSIGFRAYAAASLWTKTT